MSKNYLLYWMTKNAEYMRAASPLLDYASSNQFHNVQRDDVLWFVTVRSGRLFLVGKLTVGERTDWNGAVAILGRDNLKKARTVVLAKRGTEEKMVDIALDDIATALRFESNVNDRFKIVEGRINPQQMQAKRRLTDSSSLLLDAKWTGRGSPKTSG